MSSLDQLATAVPPPSKPTGATSEWAMVEHILGTALPQDYKAFISKYGTGTFHPAELGVWNFSTKKVDIDFFRRQNELARNADFSKTLKEFPVPILVWGVDGLASTYFWAQEGSPDEWYVIMVEGGDMYYPFPGLNLTSFLKKRFVERCSIVDGVWVSGDDLEPQTFQPASS